MEVRFFLVAIIGLVMGTTVSLYAWYSCNYAIQAKKKQNQIITYLMAFSVWGVILIAIIISGWVYDSQLFEPYDTHTGRILFMLLWLVPFGITTVIGVVRGSRALPSDHSTLAQDPFWSWFLRLGRSPPTDGVQMNRHEFLVRYEKHKTEFRRFTVAFVVAVVLVNIPVIFVLVAQVRGLSPDLFTMVWYLGFNFAVFAFFVFRIRTLINKYDFSCRNCGGSLVVDEGKSVLSTGACPACGSVVVELSSE